MITNKGKAIVSKYMIGQTPSYASYLAIGCGPAPVLPTYEFTTTTGGDIETMAAKTSLDFETLRVPIISRGYVTNDGVSQLVLTAQLPAESRYGITEVGVFPAISNPVAVGNDSRMLSNFDTNEVWAVRDASTSTSTVVEEGAINTTTPTTVFANSLDTILTNQARILNNETPRNGATSIVVPGDLTTFTTGAPSGGKYLVLANPGIDLSASSPIDKLKIAFSVIPKETIDAVAGNATIVVEFGSTQEIGTGGYARATFVVDISDTTSDTSRYFTDEIAIKDIVTSNFSWANATYLKVFVSTDSDYLIALDGMRVDNVGSESPVYGLVGYTVIKNSLTTSGGTPGAVPAIKEKDKTSLLEFRFQVSIG
jgi:hypothetical protein